MPLVAIVVNAAFDAPTAYLSAWSQHIVAKIRKSGHARIVELTAGDATPEKLSEAITRENPSLVVLNGHGAPNEVCGFNDGVLIRVNHNATMLKGRNVHALSCQAGKELGPHLIEIGGLSFIGYAEDFQFWHNGKLDAAGQVADPYASPTLEPAFRAIEALLQGESPEEAYRKSQESYQEKILALITSQDSMYNTMIAASTLHNKKYQVLFPVSHMQQPPLFG